MPTIAIGDIHGNLPGLGRPVASCGRRSRQTISWCSWGITSTGAPIRKAASTRFSRFETRSRQRSWGSAATTRTGCCGRCGTTPVTRGFWDAAAGHDPELLDRCCARAAQGGARGWAQAVCRRVRAASHVFFDAMPPAHRAFFEGLPAHVQTADCICVHAGLHPSSSAASPHEHPRESLVWGVGDFPDAYQGSEVVVYGHRNNGLMDARGWPQPRVVGADRRHRYNRSRRADRDAFPGPPRLSEREICGGGAGMAPRGARRQ